jgi:hypothetical protein
VIDERRPLALDKMKGEVAHFARLVRLAEESADAPCDDVGHVAGAGDPGSLVLAEQGRDLGNRPLAAELATGDVGEGDRPTMAADANVADPETVDRLLDRRLLARWDAVGWYDVACVAEHEQVAQLGLGQHRGVDPGIGASDKQRARALAARQALEVAASRCEDIALESPDTFY